MVLNFSAFERNNKAKKRPQSGGLNFSAFDGKTKNNTALTERQTSGISFTGRPLTTRTGESTPAVIPEGAGTLPFLKEVGAGFTRGIAATGARVARQLGVAEDDIVDPKTFFSPALPDKTAKKVGEAVFGQSVPFNATSEDVDILSAFGVEPETALKTGGSLTLLLTALDMTPVGGITKAVKTIKGLKTTDEAFKFAKKMGLNDEVAEEVAPQFVRAQTNEDARAAFEFASRRQKEVAGETGVIKQEDLKEVEGSDVPQDLAEEARKYDTAEEFVEAQRNEPFDDIGQVFEPTMRETRSSTIRSVYVQQKTTGDTWRIDFVRNKKTGEQKVEKYVISADGQAVISDGKSLSKLQEGFETKDPAEIAKGFALADEIENASFVRPKDGVKETDLGVQVDESQLTDIFNRVKGQKALGGKQKRSPSPQRLLGVEKPRKKTRTEDVLLRERLRAEVRGARRARQELPEHKEARLQLQKTIQDLDLRKWENLRDAMKFPTSLSKMTVDQIQKLNDVLSQYKYGDEFLPTRMIETLPNTRLQEVRTVREILEILARETGMTVDDVAHLKPSEFHRFMGDHMLYREHPFFQRLVLIKNKSFLEANARVIELSDEADNLVKAARQSRKRGVAEKLVPTDKNIVRWLEADASARTKLAKDMTDEEIRAAQFMDATFREYYDYLVKKNSEKRFSRFEDKYFPHVRRSFLEAWKEDGILSAFKELRNKFAQDQKYLDILNEQTGEVLPYEKWVGFTQYRTDNLIPTSNAARAFEGYVTTLEKARHLDEMVPEIMAYVHALSPRRMTERGLELDTSLKRFVKEWINANKGRTPKGFFQPGGKLDWGLRMSTVLTRMIDLGLNFTTQFAAPIGEQAMNLTMLKPAAYKTALSRRTTKQGRAILNKYENFVGRSFFKELSRASNTAGDNLMSSFFMFFHTASRKGNEIFLLGKLTPQEFKAGEVSVERLAQLHVEMNKYRVVKGAESIMGRTGEALAFKQYKNWAIPILRATATNAQDLAKIIRRDGVKKALQSEEGKELFYSIGIGSGIGLGAWGYYTELQERGSQRTFIEDMQYKAMRDAMSMLGAVDPTLWSSVRVADFYDDLSRAILDTVMLDQNQSGELSGVKTFQRTLTPRAIKQFLPKEGSSGVDIPSVNIPSVDIPSVEIPSVEVPSIRL